MIDQPEQLPEKVLDRTAAGEREWVHDHAQDRVAYFEATTRRQAIARRRADRARMTLLQRHTRVVSELARLSTVASGNVEPSRGGGEQIGPPKQQTLTHELRHPRRLMQIAVAAYEAVLDEAQGLSVLRSIDEMVTEEKDDLIMDPQHEGWTPSELEVIYQGKLGSATTIRRVRRKRNANPHTGVRLTNRTPEPDE